MLIVEVANDISARRSEPSGRNRRLYLPEPVSIRVLTSRQRGQPRKLRKPLQSPCNCTVGAPKSGCFGCESDGVSIEFTLAVYLHKRCPAQELAGGLDDCPSRPAKIVVATGRINCRLSPIITSVIDVRKIAACGESGFPARFLGGANSLGLSGYAGSCCRLELPSPERLLREKATRQHLRSSVGPMVSRSSCQRLVFANDPHPSGRHSPILILLSRPHIVDERSRLFKL